MLYRIIEMNMVEIAKTRKVEVREGLLHFTLSLDGVFDFLNHVHLQYDKNKNCIKNKNLPWLFNIMFMKSAHLLLFVYTCQSLVPHLFSFIYILAMIQLLTFLFLILRICQVQSCLVGCALQSPHGQPSYFELS